MNNQYPDLRVVKTKQNVRRALLELMSEKPFPKITVTDIAGRARINRKTFYRHYSSPDEVIAEIEDEILARFAELTSGSNLDLGASVRYFANLVREYRQVLSVIIRNTPELPYMIDFENKLYVQGAKIAVKKSGITDEKLAATLSRYIISGTLSLLKDWVERSCGEDIDSIVDIIMKIAYNGLNGFLPPSAQE